MTTDARREHLLAVGAQLLGQRPSGQVSIGEIAEAAGVSKGLLYHYFPTKKDFILASLERGQGQLAGLLKSDPRLPAAVQIRNGLDRFLGFVEEHEAAYSAIFRSRGGGDREIQAALDQGRDERLEAVVDSMVGWDGAGAPLKRTPHLETAMQGWFFFVEGAVLRWLERRDMERDELRQLLELALLGSLHAASVTEPIPLEMPGEPAAPP
ncbi:MAG TPA: TetR/AcrR family transcriptional regulator [Solirubrobacterales bacterium]|nr:TetR/AcrR family transcriptional regulator [Solirubrobacterales bacterium]